MKTVKGNINEALKQVASYNNNNLAEAMSKKMPLDVFARTVGVGAKEQQWIMDNEDEFGKYYNNSALSKSWLSLSYPVYDKDYYFAFIGDSERVNAKLNAEANRKLRDLAKSSLSNEEVYEEMEKLFNMFAFENVGAGDTMSREELWRAVRHIRGDYRESVEEGKLGNIARALLDKMRKRAKKIRIGEDLDEMRHKFVFDKAVNLSKAEKIAQQLGMKTDSETGRDYYYLSVDDGGNSGNLLKFLKATDGLHEESIIEMKFNRDGKKIEITKSGPSTKPIFHLKINGKDHGKFDQEKKAMQYVASLKEEDDLNEARIVISTLMYDAITKLGLAQIMKKHDAYVNKQQTDKEYTTLSSPSPMFGRDLSNLIKKNSDKLLKILPEETQVMINEARIANYKPTKFEGKEFDRKKELKALKNMHNAIMKIAKMQDDMQYTAETGGTPRIGNPHAIHQSLRSAEQAIFDYMGGIERGHYDGVIDMDRD